MTPLDTLPAGSRAWVFAASRELTADDEARLTAIMEKVLGVWRTKAACARGCYEIRDRRFLVVGVDETGERLSGCSIDAMMSWTMKLEAELGLKLVDRMSVHWRDADGRVHSTSRAEFKQLFASGAVGPETHVFDTTVSTVDALRDGRFETPLRASWHAQLLAAPAVARN